MIRARKKSRYVTAQNFKIETIFFCRFYFRVARATSDRNLIHSADACFLVMACVRLLARAAKNSFEPPQI